MKKHLILFGIMLGSFVSCQERKKDNATLNQKTLLENRCDTAWYEDGKIKSIENYIQGKLNGMQVYFAPSGCILSEGNYLKGEKHGVFISCIKPKKLFKVCEFIHNIKQGFQVVYDLEQGVVSLSDNNGGEPSEQTQEGREQRAALMVEYLKKRLSERFDGIVL